MQPGCVPKLPAATAQAREKLAGARAEASRLNEESNALLTKAQQIIAAARDEADTTTSEAEARVQMLTRTADNYSARVRSEADQAARRVRTLADDDAAKLRSQVETEVNELARRPSRCSLTPPLPMRQQATPRGAKIEAKQLVDKAIPKLRTSGPRQSSPSRNCGSRSSRA